MAYNVGDPLVGSEPIVRRLKKRWMKDPTFIHHEAFAPRKFENGGFENGVSIEVMALLNESIGNDKWSNHPTDPRGTCQLLAQDTTDQYPVIFDGEGDPAHGLITGNMSELYEDEMALRKMAKAAVRLHSPWNPTI